MSLREAAQQALEALEQIRTPLRINTALDAYDVSRAIAALRTALSEPETEADTYKRLYELRGKALERPCFHCGYKPRKIYPMEQRTEPEQEPVAWRYEAATAIFESGEYGGWQRQISEKEPCAPENSIRNLQPLYTHLPQHKPLTDEEIDAVTIEQWGEMKGYPLAAHRAFARAIERAHGIGGEK